MFELCCKVALLKNYPHGWSESPLGIILSGYKKTRIVGSAFRPIFMNMNREKGIILLCCLILFQSQANGYI